jgi:hypothetical protein
MRITTPITIQSQRREEPDPLLAAAELLAGAFAAGATALWVADGRVLADAPGLGTETLALRLGKEMLALRLGEKLAIGPPPLCPQAATRNPARRIAPVSSRPSIERRIRVPPRIDPGAGTSRQFSGEAECGSSPVSGG